MKLYYLIHKNISYPFCCKQVFKPYEMTIFRQTIHHHEYDLAILVVP